MPVLLSVWASARPRSQLSDLMGDLGEAAQTDLMYENKKRELPSSGMGTATKMRNRIFYIFRYIPVPFHSVPFHSVP